MGDNMTGLTYTQIRELMMGFLKSGDTGTVLYLEGHQGIGKTELVMDCAAEFFGGEEWKGKDLRKFSQGELPFFYAQEYPATKQVEDYTGIPFNVDGRTRWTCDERFPLKRTDGSAQPRGVYVLEELNQATDEVLKAMFPLLQDKQIAGHVLSPDVFIVVTGNPANSIHHVSDFPPALKDRMQRVGMVHSAKDWLAWARGHGIHESVTSFIDENPSMLWMMPGDGGVGPTPRAWANVSKSVDKMEKGLIKEYMLVELLRNKVGDSVATKFLGFLKNNFKKAITVEEMFKDWEKGLERYIKQHAAGKAETLDTVFRWMEEKAKGLQGKGQKDLEAFGSSAEMKMVEEICVRHTPDAILIAKVLSAAQTAINVMAVSAPHGIHINQHVVGIAIRARQAGKKMEDLTKEAESAIKSKAPATPTAAATSSQQTTGVKAKRTRKAKAEKAEDATKAAAKAESDTKGDNA